MGDFVPYKLYGVIGQPLGHSLSPLLHTTAFRALGIPAVLTAWPMPPDKLPAFIDACRLLDIQGACVTLPHKERIIPLLDSLTDRARATGAVNLIYRDGDKLCGDNTDVPGFLDPLNDNPLPSGAKALILGAGGAARSVAAGLKNHGLTDITVTNRTERRAVELSRDFSLKTIPWEQRGAVEAQLVVNATSLGMKGEHERETPYPAQFFQKRAGLAYDVVYTPFDTRFLTEAKKAGWNTHGGLRMFLGQANVQFTTWTGLSLPEAAKEKVLEALKLRGA